jgi:nucleotide-binding universal stress UspA family protein
MSYASLLVYVEDSVESDERVQLASSLAARFNAKLVGVTGAMIESPMADPAGFMSASADTVNGEIALAESSAKALEARFRSAAVLGRESLEWDGTIQFPADAVFHKSSTADLIIVGRQSRSRPNILHSSLDPADVLMRCGRPVLIVPPGPSKIYADHIVVAWSNTREARRAVIDALPLLREASRVSVVEVIEAGGMSAATKRVSDVAEFLMLHDVDAKSHVIELIDGSVSDEIVQYAEHQLADLIVAGGYGHARAREWIFGGVTRELLTHCPKCCLISH